MRKYRPSRKASFAFLHSKTALKEEQGSSKRDSKQPVFESTIRAINKVQHLAELTLIENNNNNNSMS